MSPWLLLSAVLTVAVGVAHSYLGERYILIRLFRRDDLPPLFGSDRFTKATLRFAWHITTVAWWGSAALFLVLGRGEVTAALRVLSVTFLISALITAVASRGRHLAWPVFTAIAAGAWLGVPGAAPCSDAAASVAFADATEEQALAAAAPMVVRTGCRLTFRGPQGDELTLDDLADGTGARLIHRYRGHRPDLGAHLVEVSRMEGGHILLVYPGGALFSLAGEPRVAPGGAHFVAWRSDLVAGHQRNALELWRRTPSGARLELAIGSDDWGPAAVRWLDAATVAFTQEFQEFAAAPAPASAPRESRLVRRDGRWLPELARP